MPSDQHQQQQQHWSYLDNAPGGPADWAKYYPTGQHQSPINILVEPCEQANGHARASQTSYRQQQQLAGQLQRRLKISAANGQPPRPHLDSLGNDVDVDQDVDQDDHDPDDADDHQRSPSTSSAGSSSSQGSGLESPRGGGGGGRSASPAAGLHSTQALIAGAHPPRAAPLGGSNTGGGGGSLVQCSKQNTRYCATNRKIFLGYPRYLSSLQLCNTGHAWQVNLPPELASHTLLAGPSLGDREYRLAQLHCHWGSDCQHGSEHLINGQSFSAEIHFVHWNCTDFSSMEEASRHKHGLAVLGVLVQALEGERHRNRHLDKIVAALPRVREAHSSAQLSEARLDLKKLFPANRWSYATYEGSLTTPPLSEVVDWLVFLEPIRCSAAQVAEFRRLQCPEGRLTRNCRPIQPANNRLVTLWSHNHH